MAFADELKGDHITRTIVEFDRLGRQPFLDKYGYGVAKRYYIRHHDKLYDAKAILGVAFKFSSHGKPLSQDNFGGGKTIANRKLTALGFEVVDGLLWSDDELEAVMRSYLRLLSDTRISKSAMRKELLDGPLAKRSAGSIERRMSNLTAYFHSKELPRIPGYKPLENIGTSVKARLDGIFGDMSGELLDIAFVRSQAAIKFKQPKPIVPPIGNLNPKKRESAATGYVRDASVVAWVLQQSEGKCEYCACEAPFFGKDGLPYLEVHHVTFFSVGGRDTIDNTAALCPNCHRETHFGREPEIFHDGLQNKVTRLQP